MNPKSIAILASLYTQNQKRYDIIPFFCVHLNVCKRNQTNPPLNIGYLQNPLFLNLIKVEHPPHIAKHTVNMMMCMLSSPG